MRSGQGEVEPSGCGPGGFCVALGRRYYLASVLWYQVVARSSDPHILAQAALRLLEQPTLRHRLGQQAREHVRRHFTSEQFARAVEAVFDELLCNLASEQ